MNRLWPSKSLSESDTCVIIRGLQYRKHLQFIVITVVTQWMSTAQLWKPLIIVNFVSVHTVDLVNLLLVLGMI